uniref:Uncharacterized protein n=1 Tax=Trieres chinensis TaxID=1514140 RepID=A0A7S2EGA1_TRICV
MATTAEATVLFDDMSKRVFDCVWEKIETGIKEGVSSLPFVRSSGTDDDVDAGDEKLMAIFRREYTTNLETVQLHADRNLFSLHPSYTKRKRENILRAFLYAQAHTGEVTETKKKNISPETKKKNMSPRNCETGSVSHQVKSGISPQMPQSRNDVPSPGRLKSIDTETGDLLGRLRSLERIRSKLRAKLGRLRQINGAVNSVKRTLDECVQGSGDQIYESTKAVLLGKEVLQSLNERGEKLSLALTEETDGRGDDGDEGTIDLSKIPKLPLKPLSLEDDYEQRRHAIETEVGSFAKISEALRKKRRSN